MGSKTPEDHQRGPNGRHKREPALRYTMLIQDQDHRQAPASSLRTLPSQLQLVDFLMEYLRDKMRAETTTTKMTEMELT
jgi:hypothetical protein